MTRWGLVLCINQEKEKLFVKCNDVMCMQLHLPKKAKTHTILSCISASGYVLPPMMVYPRKQSLPGKFKGAISNTCTLFVSSKNGRINTAPFNFCSGSNFS